MPRHQIMLQKSKENTDSMNVSLNECLHSYHHRYNEHNSGTGTTYPSEAPEFIPRFSAEFMLLNL
jgi:hypothetical protein